jgi:hypothetical protein
MNPIGYCMILFWITIKNVILSLTRMKNSLDKLLSNIKLVQRALVFLALIFGPSADVFITLMDLENNFNQPIRVRRQL